MNSVTKTQLNAADSLLFAQIFNQQKYADDSAFPGNWYVNDTIQSTAELQTALDSAFKFKLHDFDSLHTMTVVDTLFYDSLRNNTYNSYPFVYPQKDPLVNIKFSLNGKTGISQTFLFPSDTASQSKTAHLILPGNGNNVTSVMVQGGGYPNLLCYLSNHLKLYGDVYAYMKPNEEARAIYWNQNKLNHSYLVSYLDTSMHHPYGLNYLLEIIATIKFLKEKYCKVIVYGLSEGGYASLLASLIEKPNAAFICAGYAVGFDTSWSSYSILQERFDSLVFNFHKDTIKSLIQAGTTEYMFSWGDGDATNLMQAEHDSNYTQNFLNDSLHCSFYYNYQGHTFPSCGTMDTFAKMVIQQPILDFFILDTTNADTMQTMVSNCDTTLYSFDLYRNDTLHQQYSNVQSDTLLLLVDSGMYHIRNITNAYNDSTFCNDSIYFDKKPVVANSMTQHTKAIMIRYTNPVIDRLQIEQISNTHKKYYYSISDILGNEKASIQSENQVVYIDMQSQPAGVYFLKVWNETQKFSGKVIKN
ncbi:MAG: T9SS type A sorting domain-containing protein [Bacteroidetes bacterium]|nr:T9SS type A sorting domain-containing protein [Bacteroidota bacterium]MBP6314663.1 T9SS type A sorting domain-containing protein [Chitinophagaceae bacterium]